MASDEDIAAANAPALASVLLAKLALPDRSDDNCVTVSAASDTSSNGAATKLSIVAWNLALAGAVALSISCSMLVVLKIHTDHIFPDML